jgi:hypothetical protein
MGIRSCASIDVQHRHTHTLVRLMVTKMQRCMYESCQRMIQTETERQNRDRQRQRQRQTETETDTRCMHMNIHAFVLSCVMF